MVARVATVAFQGIEVLEIDVQVQMAGGFAGFTVVGLPDKAVGESRERVRAALSALGLAIPPKRITVNLAPADVLKGAIVCPIPGATQAKWLPCGHDWTSPLGSETKRNRWNRSRVPPV